MPLAEPQVPAHPVTPQAPLPPATVDGLLRHAPVGSQFLDGKEPVRAAHKSRAPGRPVPDRCTLTCGHVVKFAVAPGGRQGNLRPPRVGRWGVTRAKGRGSRAVAISAVLVPPRASAPVRAREQRGLACRPVPAISSADSARDVKPMAAGSPARPGAVSGNASGDGTARLPAGGLTAVRPGRGARAPRALVRGGRCEGRRSGPPWAGAQAFRYNGVADSMNGGEGDLFSGRCPRQLGHGMGRWEYRHGTQVPLPPQIADNS